MRTGILIRLAQPKGAVPVLQLRIDLIAVPRASTTSFPANAAPSASSVVVITQECAVKSVVKYRVINIECPRKNTATASPINAQPILNRNLVSSMWAKSEARSKALFVTAGVDCRSFGPVSDNFYIPLSAAIYTFRTRFGDTKTSRSSSSPM
jgi:hypothetical protein